MDYKPYPEIKNKSEYFKTKKNDLNIFYTKKDTCGYNKSPCTNYRQNIKNINIKKLFKLQIYFSKGLKIIF